MNEKIMKETGKVFAIVLDTKGPEIRTGEVPNDGEVELKKGQKFTVTTDYPSYTTNERCSVSYAGLVKDIAVGNTILIDDGLIGLKVLEKNADETEAVCEVLNNAMLGNKKGVNLPGVITNLPALSEKDKGDLVFGIERRTLKTFVTGSTSTAVRTLRSFLRSKTRKVSITSKTSLLHLTVSWLPVVTSVLKFHLRKLSLLRSTSSVVVTK